MNLENWIDKNLEPPEDDIVAYDWKGSEIYAGTEVLVVEDEYIVNEDWELADYMRSMYQSRRLE